MQQPRKRILDRGQHAVITNLNQTRQARLILLIALLATVGLYWQGLSGPYLFDDYWNLAPVELWHAGKQSWQMTLLPDGTSIVSSRPVAMASFMLTIWLGGIGPFPFKLGNLVIHLLCGALGYWVLNRMMREDRRLVPYAPWLAAAAAGLWLLHPLHVSTVLYAIQRMAQLSTLFSLAAVGAYLVARRQLIAGRRRIALVNLFAVFPVLVTLGVLSKQNAAIAGLLCLALEFAYFTREKNGRGILVAFFLLFALIPIVAVLGLLAIAPQRLLAGFSDWDFSVWQRLLTQPRVLVDYVGMWFVPRAPLMGLYTDDYPVSVGLMEPPATLFGILALVAISTLAIAFRKRSPSFFAGWFFFLIAHSVEASFLPLEMYYEHRNYLPSFGLMLALFGLTALVPDNLKTNVLSIKSLGKAAIVVFAMSLCFATLGRVLVWQNEESMVEQGVKHHPESIRVHLDKAAMEMRKLDYAAAIRTMTPLLASSNPKHRLVARMELAGLNCLNGTLVSPEDLRTAMADAQTVLTVNNVHSVELLKRIKLLRKCPQLPEHMLGDVFVSLADAANEQAEYSMNKSTVRKVAALMYVRVGLWQKAEPQLEIVWRATANAPAGALLARAYILNGKHAEARRVVSDLGDRIRPFETAGQAELSRLRAMLKADGANP